MPDAARRAQLASETQLVALETVVAAGLAEEG